MASTVLTPAELGTMASGKYRRLLLHKAKSKTALAYRIPSELGPLRRFVNANLYYLAFPNDRVGFKAAVYAAYLLEMTQTTLFTRSSFQAFATGFGNPTILDKIDFLWFSVPVISGLVAFVAHSFYAYRIAVFSQKKYLPGCVILLACLSFSASIAVGVEMKDAEFFTHFVKKDSLVTVGIWQAGSAACDVLIAASMTYYLRRHDTEIPETQDLLTRIIRLTIETGSLTATIAIITLTLTFLTGKNYYQASVAVLGKMYSNSMMVAFNSRMRINNGSSTSFTFPIASQGTPTRFDMDLELNGRSLAKGVLITREEISFPSPNESLQDKKKNTEDVYWTDPSDQLSTK
ncbi:hypothetical protein GALMADRAFT_143958 [Galerina marginata CBS 339.88]|uniref:DUF6534 domain-containing protein n=1 Tax=Galerina marginata (strain CBS 339.88) TaxID=685588 RepID=A0A067SJW9_GALM3|nr:hypothetical protein GALMADRAFT_143958 [Galerina marginata CBS 339.88]